MELSDLIVFRTVVQEDGITRAAEKLHRVQSNVTTRIKKLEQDLGTELFIRQGKRLYLSSAGQTLLQYADELIDLAAEAREAVKDNQPRGTFRLGAMESTAIVRLPEPISRFHDLHPQVSIELQTGNPKQLSLAVLAGDIDAALVTEPIADEQFEKAKIFQEKVVIVTRDDHHAIKGKNDLPETIIVFEQGCPHRNLLELWYQQLGEIPHRIVELGSYHAMLSCVIAGMGAALLPQSVLTTFPEARRLKIHKLPKTLDSLETKLIWRKNAFSPNIEAFRSVLGAG